MEVTKELKERRERVFLVLAGIFLCAMTMLNILGITRFIQLGYLSLAVGVLPYPLTFLCTDLISELYGRARANFLVTIGLGLNCFIIVTLWIASLIPSVAPELQPPWQVIHLAESIALPDGDSVEDSRGTVYVAVRNDFRCCIRLHDSLHRRPVLRCVHVPLPGENSRAASTCGCEITAVPLSARGWIHLW